MNIFYLHRNVNACAIAHVDRHVVKMILEYAQLLSTAHRVIDGEAVVGLSSTGRKQTIYPLTGKREVLLYKATHINHPSAVWVRQSTGNYEWLHSLLVAVCKEYTYRYGKVHSCERSGLVALLALKPRLLPVGEFTQPPQAMPEEYTQADSVKAYRAYYIGAKKHLHSWKLRRTPVWVTIA